MWAPMQNSAVSPASNASGSAAGGNACWPRKAPACPLYRLVLRGSNWEPPIAHKTPELMFGRRQLWYSPNPNPNHR